MALRRRMLDDIAKLSTAAAGVIQGAGREAEVLLRQRLERLLDGMDLVTREEFEAVKAMAAQARTEQEILAARLAKLEQKLAATETEEESEPSVGPEPESDATVEGERLAD